MICIAGFEAEATGPILELNTDVKDYVSINDATSLKSIVRTGTKRRQSRIRSTPGVAQMTTRNNKYAQQSLQYPHMSRKAPKLDTALVFVTCKSA